MLLHLTDWWVQLLLVVDHADGDLLLSVKVFLQLVLVGKLHLLLRQLINQLFLLLGLLFYSYLFRAPEPGYLRHLFLQLAPRLVDLFFVLFADFLLKFGSLLLVLYPKLAVDVDLALLRKRLRLGFHFLVELFHYGLLVLLLFRLHLKLHLPLLLGKLFLVHLLDLLRDFSFDLTVFYDVVEHFVPDPRLNLPLRLLLHLVLESLRKFVALLVSEILKAGGFYLELLALQFHIKLVCEPGSLIL